MGSGLTFMYKYLYTHSHTYTYLYILTHLLTAINTALYHEKQTDKKPPNISGNLTITLSLKT